MSETDTYSITYDKGSDAALAAIWIVEAIRKAQQGGYKEWEVRWWDPFEGWAKAHGKV